MVTITTMVSVDNLGRYMASLSFQTPFPLPFSFLLFLPSLVSIPPVLSSQTPSFRGFQRGHSPRKSVGLTDACRRVLAHCGNRKQQLNTSSFTPVNFGNSVELRIQVGGKLNDQ
jgi:hypothetical protein